MDTWRGSIPCIKEDPIMKSMGMGANEYCDMH